MEIRRAMPVVKAHGPAEARAFCEGFLGFRVAMDEDGMLMFASRSTPTTQLIVAWPSPNAADPGLLGVDISVEVADVDAAFERAQADGLEIVRGIRTEACGIRRSVRDGTGRTVNVASHV
jgi:catechol 2,3-dioxygenase-like lactoylglutathione lyase family enzyme